MSHGVWHDAVQNKLTDLEIKFCEIICGIRNIKVSKYEEKNLARPRLMDFIKGLDDTVLESMSCPSCLMK
jgi:hypothetical protein